MDQESIKNAIRDLEKLSEGKPEEREALVKAEAREENAD